MALLVWLPLNGDLRNLGLSDYSFLTDGATVDNNGKIGKCYYLNLKVLYNTDFDLPTTSSSVCMWVKFTAFPSSSNAYVFTVNGKSSSDYQTMFGIYSNNATTAVLRYNLSNDIGTLNLNTWYHLCYTYDGSTVNLYIDGELKKSANLAVKTARKHLVIGGRSDNSSGTEFIGVGAPAYYNDIRVYDHCLSPKEVKEISKGLVLHYKLDDTDFGNPNLLKGTEYLDTDVTVYTGVTKTANAYKHFTSATYDNSSGTSIHELMAWNKKITVNANDVYTLSFYAKSAVSTMVACFFWNNDANIVLVQSGISSEGTVTSSRDGNIDVPLTTEWKRYWITWTFNSTATSATKTILFRCQPYRGDISVCGVKLEKGNKATPTDPIILDCSGYLNNGVVIRNLSTDNQDTPRYNSSIKFTETTTKIKAGSINTLGFSDSYTFAWWGRISTFSGKMFWGFSDGIRLNGIYNGNLWNTGDSSNNPLYKPGTTTQVIAPSVNVWHHFAMVGNGTTCLVYLDGVLWGLAKTYKSISGTTIFFNGWDANDNYANNNTCISDFRIYSTVLSEEDIKELYNTSAIVDNLGNNYCYLFEEEFSNNITKTGIVSSNLFIEKTDYLYLLAGNSINTELYYNAGDVCLAITTIRYDSGGSGRDLMGFSGAGAGYWGVTAAGAWEPHGTFFSYTNSDITQINTISYLFTAKNNDVGYYRIGSLDTAIKYSVRNKYIYSVKLYKNNILERDLIPFKEGTQYGLYDLVNKHFYACNTGGTLSIDKAKETKIFNDHLETNQLIEM